MWPEYAGLLPPGWQEPKAQEQAKEQKKERSWQVYYYHCDHLGTPREVTGEDGALHWRASYRTWGNTLKVQTTGQVRQNLRFQGQYFDEETGLHYNRFRCYDPGIGRFVSQDPIGLLGGENLYEYAPNPTKWIDPLGLSRFKRTTWGPCKNGKGTGLAYTVYQQDIDWNLKVDGETNLELATRGNAPYIIKDGVPQQLQLHHSRQQSIGPLFEVTTSTHQAKKGAGQEALHPYGNKKNPDFPVDRGAFGADREQYWKDRAAAAKC